MMAGFNRAMPMPSYTCTVVFQAVEWLETFGLDLSLLSQCGGHDVSEHIISVSRCVRLYGYSIVCCSVLQQLCEISTTRGWMTWFGLHAHRQYILALHLMGFLVE